MRQTDSTGTAVVKWQLEVQQILPAIAVSHCSPCPESTTPLPHRLVRVTVTKWPSSSGLLEVQAVHMRTLVECASMLAAALVPHVDHERAVRMARHAHTNRIGLRQAALAAAVGPVEPQGPFRVLARGLSRRT